MRQPSDALSARSSPVVKAGRCFVQTVGLLVLFSVARTFGLLGQPAVSVGLLVLALVLVAWSAGASLDDLGLGRADVPAGLGYGAGAVGVVLLVLLVAALIPATNGFLHDSRAAISGARLLYELGVSIVLLTAIPEEFAFRGVLLGSGLRLWSPWRASLISSALFGLWHIAPALHTMSDNRAVAGVSASAAGPVLLVLSSFAVRSPAGVVFCCLRWRSRGLIARVMAHAATTGLALPVGWFAVHWGSPPRPRSPPLAWLHSTIWPIRSSTPSSGHSSAICSTSSAPGHRLFSRRGQPAIWPRTSSSASATTSLAPGLSCRARGAAWRNDAEER